ncbi:MAG: hypothetical protein JSS43_01165 [Proteobacteria bacterium]|nr:hypothetical protein [Pseudomonadota bacterium]
MRLSRDSEVEMNPRLARALLPMVTGAGCMIALLSAMNAVLAWRNAAPAAGDMIAFVASGTPANQHMPRLYVETAEGARCAIDVTTIQRSGGSFLVEARLQHPADRFVLRWIGLRTAEGEADCGRDRALVVDRQQLETLVVAAATGAILAPNGVVAGEEETAQDQPPA